MAESIIIECDKDSYAPGEMLSGKVLWDCSKVPNCIILELKWNTEGRGTTDKEKVAKETIPCGRADGEATFKIQIPKNCPPSYKGSLVSIMWSISARADLSWKIDPKTSYSVIISPNHRELSIPSKYEGEK